MSGEDGLTDLFGHPVRAGHGKRGRPAFVPDEKMTNKVKLLLACGWSNGRIANAIGISAGTLARHFKLALRERGQMRDRLEARRLEIAMDLAQAGNVAALKELGKLVERNDRLLGLAELEGAQRGAEPVERKPAKTGKKDDQAEAARRAASDQDEWGGDLVFSGGPRPN